MVWWTVNLDFFVHRRTSLSQGTRQTRIAAEQNDCRREDNRSIVVPVEMVLWRRKTVRKRYWCCAMYEQLSRGKGEATRRETKGCYEMPALVVPFPQQHVT